MVRDHGLIEAVQTATRASARPHMDFILGGGGGGGDASAATGAATGAAVLAASAIPRSSYAVATGSEPDSLMPMPDLFEKIRPLVCAADGSPRLFVRAGPYISAWIVVASPAITLQLAWSYSGFGVVDVILSGGWWVVFSFVGFFPQMLHQ